MKKVLLVLAGLILVAIVGLFLWARAVLGGDAVRAGIESQLATHLGQPVRVGSAAVAIWPRVTLALDDVSIGEPARISVRRLHVGTALRALLSRRIEHATVDVSGARLELPLPPLAFAAPASPAAPAASRPPVEIVSIDTVTFTNVEIVSGGRALRGDIDVVPAGQGLRVRRIALEADDTSLEITGVISDLAGPVGELTVKARGLNVLDLLAFVTDFSRGIEPKAGATARAAQDRVAMDLRVSVDAGRAVVGTLALDGLAGQARVTPTAVALEPVSFGVFGGRYSGTLTWRLGQTSAFSLKASLSGVDVSQAMAFAGSDGAVTGRLSGTMDVSGRGTTAEAVISSARGTARLDIVNGTVAGLGLVREVVVATSGRAGSKPAVPAGRGAPEPFSRLGATFALGEGLARTSDLRFESPDVLLAAAGAIALKNQAVNLAGDVQLSAELSKQAGRDLVRYSAREGRVTLPVTITGVAGNLTVRPEVGEAAKRAITKRAAEEAKKLLKRIIR